MLNQELPIFHIKRVIQVIPDIVSMHFSFGGIDLGVAMDDHTSGSLFPKDLRIDIGDMFRQHNGDVDGALPCVAFGLFQGSG